MKLNEIKCSRTKIEKQNQLQKSYKAKQIIIKIIMIKIDTN